MDEYKPADSSVSDSHYGSLEEKYLFCLMYLEGEGGVDPFPCFEGQQKCI